MARHTRSTAEPTLRITRRRTVRRSRFLVGATVALMIPTLAMVLGDTQGTAAAPQNLVQDPNFTDPASYWSVTPGTQTAVVAGYNGAQALQVTNVGSAPVTVNINDKTNTVASTDATSTYVASGWVKVSTPGTSAAVREGAWVGSQAAAAPQLTSVNLTDGNWHLVQVSYAPNYSGASIDLNFLAWQLPVGVSFFLSEPTLAVQPADPGAPTTGSTPPPTDTPTTTAPSTSAPSTTASTSSQNRAVPPTTGPTVTRPGGGSRPTGAPRQRVLFDDEFNGTSVNTSNWTVRNNSYLGYDYGYITSRPQNVNVANGALTITAQPEKTTAYGKTFPYTTGYLDTINHFSAQYGRWVMRAQLPQLEGMWPAFWLRSNSGGGEIDIMEAIGGMPRMAQQTLIQDTNSGKVKTVTVTNMPATTTTAAWHTYGFSWSPTQMTWDIDGQIVKTVRSTDVSWYRSTFNGPVNIRLNLQVGGSMPAYFHHDLKAAPTAASKFVIDYIRVYSN